MNTSLLYDPVKVYKRKKDLMPPVINRWTSFMRIQPDFFIGGVQKGGTSSLAYALVQHPQILPSKNKEMFYYSITPNYLKGKFYYRQFFATIFYKWYKTMKVGKQVLCFDATTNTLDSKEAPMRIFKDNQKAKIIFLLRNPVFRAYSHYKMAVKNGLEFADFEKALELEALRIEEGKNHPLSHPDHNYSYQRLGYKSRGVYVNHLKNWLEVFSKNNILLLNSEDFFNSPLTNYSLVCEFLEIEKIKEIRFEKLNEGSPEPLKPSTKKMLEEFYKPYNEELFRLIGMRYDW